MPWREAAARVRISPRRAQRALVAVVVVAAAATSLRGTSADAGMPALELLPPTTSTTTTTTVPPPVEPPPPPPVTHPPLVSPGDSERVLGQALAELLPGRGPLPADVAIFSAQVAASADAAVMAREFVAHRYANLIDRRAWFRAIGAAAPPCELVVGREAWTEPAHRLPLDCP